MGLKTVMFFGSCLVVVGHMAAAGVPLPPPAAKDQFPGEGKPALEVVTQISQIQSLPDLEGVRKKVS